MRSKFRIGFLLLFGGVWRITVAQNTVLPAQVDPRVELLSIVFRLAGSEEYSSTYLKSYTDDIEKHFAPFRKHAAVERAKKMANKGVGHDGVMALAVHLTPPPEFKPRIPFDDQKPDARWGKKNAEEFAALLRAFYKDAKCEAFFNAHEAFYATAVKNFETTLQGSTDTKWFASFFGEEAGDFKLIIGLGNGGNNYGATVTHPDGHEDRYSIISNSLPDSTGMPTFKLQNIRSTIIHEYNHSFINHLVYKAPDLFLPEIKEVFGAVKEKMRALHYGQWEIMVNESLVRAGEIQYDKMHGASEKEILSRVRAEQARGFVWMDQLVELLGKYNVNRTTYPDFNSFLPEIATFYKSVPAEKLVKAYEEKCAHVVQIVPLQADPVHVDPSLTELTIHFDNAMSSGISINLSEKGADHFPLVRSKDAAKWAEDGKSLSLKVTLKPGWEYSFVLTPLSFRTTEGYPLREYSVSFKTATPKTTH